MTGKNSISIGYEEYDLFIITNIIIFIFKSVKIIFYIIYYRNILI